MSDVFLSVDSEGGGTKLTVTDGPDTNCLNFGIEFLNVYEAGHMDHPITLADAAALREALSDFINRRMAEQGC